jgi:hypothetical protein
MKDETKKLARDMYSTILINAHGLHTVSEEERMTIFKQAAEFCFEAAAAFEEVSTKK